MWLYLLTIAIGFVVLTWSADRFIEGAAVTARRLGVPPLVVGLTVVGIGTSAPELLVSALAAYEGSPGLAVGNALGSNIANTGLILGLTALAFPLAVRSSILRREIPVLLIIVAALLPLMLDDYFARWEGALLVAGMGAVLVWMGVQARKGAPDPISAEYAAEIPADVPLSRALVWLVAGLVLLLASSRALVWAAVEVALALGVDELVIGLTIVALGTSLPELAACIASARKGEHDIAVGNILGSNMFNLLGVIGIAALITPHAVPAEALGRDYVAMAAVTVLFVIFAFGFRNAARMSRGEGALLLAFYIGYQLYLFFDANPEL